MSQRQQETTPTTKILWDRNLPPDVDIAGIMSTKEREWLVERDIFIEAGEEYEPLDEARLRIVNIKLVDIQRRVSRFPRWERIILKSLADLKEQVSNLQKQVEELTEAVRETAKTYNATIHELGNSQYELTTPIQVVVEEDQEETIARIPELNLYASADTDSEAIKELKQEVIDLYEDLQSSDRKLGPLPKSWLQTLRKLIVKKNG